MSTSTIREVPTLPVSNGTKKILLVENSDTTRLTHRILITKRTSHTVVSVGNGNDALKMAEVEKPDLILMDVVMPGMDGLEVCRRLRRLTATARIPIVLMTFRDGDGARAEGLASGCNDLLRKPLTADDLVNALRKHLGAASPRV